MGVAVTTIRPFEPADIPAAVALEEANQPRPWTVGMFEDELGRDNRSYLVADVGGMAGFGGVMVIGDEAHVTNLLVSPDRRRQGIGQRLMARLVRDAVEMGACHLTLEVRSQNTAARRLYHRFGLVPVGVRPGYYDGEDALIMWAHDIDSHQFAARRLE